jgi:hypothetical protein
MYSTCLFCNKTLGSNETFETFPVGKRLAFDAVKGRLWVVCSHCERWNLTPLEDRWEAIELAEKLYSDSRRRVSTDNIGLSKLRDGTTLVRIGEPQRPEFAAWRYGDQFGRRRRRQMLLVGGGVTAVGVLVGAGAAAGVGIGGFGWGLSQVVRALISGNPESVVAKIKTEHGAVLPVRRRHLNETSLSQADDGSLAIDLRYKNGKQRFTGREAERIASIVVPKVNRYGGNKAAVADAVSVIENGGGPEAYLAQLSSMGYVMTRPSMTPAGGRWGRRVRWGSSNQSSQGLFALPTPHRLALEMALHEEAERRALRGELVELERAWREAEEIAGIADELLVPESVDGAYARLKGS